MLLLLSKYTVFEMYTFSNTGLLAFFCAFVALHPTKSKSFSSNNSMNLFTYSHPKCDGGASGRFGIFGTQVKCEHFHEFRAIEFDTSGVQVLYFPPGWGKCLDHYFPSLLMRVTYWWNFRCSVAVFIRTNCRGTGYAISPSTCTLANPPLINFLSFRIECNWLSSYLLVIWCNPVGRFASIVILRDQSRENTFLKALFIQTWHLLTTYFISILVHVLKPTNKVNLIA